MDDAQKYVSCSKCLEKALELKESPIKEDWDQLGKEYPHCTACIDALKEFSGFSSGSQRSR